jgi:hypothetical protein
MPIMGLFDRFVDAAKKLRDALRHPIPLFARLATRPAGMIVLA